MKSLYSKSSKKIVRTTCFLIVLILTFSLQSKAAWIQTGPEGGSFFIKENNGILYSTNAIGLYKSSDNGLNWTRVSTMSGFTMNDLVFTTNKMIASTNKGIFYSIDGGINWVSSNQGMTNVDTTGIGAFFIYQLSNNRLLTSVLSGTYFSDNNGQSWTISTGGAPFNALCQQGSNIFGLGGSDIYQSSNNGQNWTVASSAGINATDITNMVKIFTINNTLIIGCNSTAAYTSSDNGQNWNLVPTGVLTGFNQGSIYVFNNTIYKKTSTGYFTLNLVGNTWITNNITQSNDIGILGYYNGRFFGSNTISFEDVVFSDNNGLSWQNTNGIKCMVVRKISKSENLFVLGDGAAFLLDTLNISFHRNSPYNNNFSSNSYSQYEVYDIKIRSNGTIYLATAGGVWKSINNGASYTQSYNGLPQTGTIPVYQVNDLIISGTFPNDTLFAATDNGIYFSTNDAQTFSLCNGTSGAKMQQFLNYQNVMYCAGTKIFRRGNPNSWSQFTTFVNTGILGFAATDGYLFLAVANSPIKYAPINGLASFSNIINSPVGTYNSNSVAAFDTLLFFRNQNGVFKVNTTTIGTTQPSDVIQIADNLPFYYNPGNVKQYNYIGGSASYGLAVFNGKLWLGTNGMSTFYRSLNDFGYSLTVGGQDNMRQEQGVVYPNPSNDKITMTNFTIGSNLNIYNSVGQLVLNMTYTNSNTVDLNKLNAGLYTYLIIDNKQNIIDNGKFVKE